MFLGREATQRHRPRRDRRWRRRAAETLAGPVGAHREVGAPAASPACPAASARPSRSPGRCSGTPSSSSSTSRPPRSASRRPSRCSTSSAGSPTTASAVVLISHNMNDVFAGRRPIAVLYLGQMAAQVPAKDVTHGQVVELITGRAQRRPRPRPSDRDARPVSMTTHRRAADSAHRRRGDSTAARQARPRRARSATTSTRVRGGDMGSLPAVLGLVVLVVVFAVARAETFLTAAQHRQPAHPGRRRHRVIAMGLVFVLLLGEIDLSAGFTAGTCGGDHGACCSPSSDWRLAGRRSVGAGRPAP